MGLLNKKVIFTEKENKLINTTLLVAFAEGHINGHIYVDFNVFSAYLYIKRGKVWYKKLDYSKRKPRSYTINSKTSELIISYLKKNDALWCQKNIQYFK